MTRKSLIMTRCVGITRKKLCIKRVFGYFAALSMTTKKSVWQFYKYDKENNVSLWQDETALQYNKKKAPSQQRKISKNKFRLIKFLQILFDKNSKLSSYRVNFLKNFPKNYKLFSKKFDLALTTIRISLILSERMQNGFRISYKYECCRA